MAALDGEGGGFAVTGGADADVTAGVDVGACGGGGGGRGAIEASPQSFDVLKIHSLHSGKRFAL